MNTPEITDDMDISKIVTGERTVEILHPQTDEKLGISVSLMSIDDPRLRRHQRNLIDKQNERRRKNKILSAEETEKGIVELLANSITGWDWGKRTYKGEVPQFSLRKAIEILSDPNISWFFDQINEEVGNTKDFF